MIATLSTANEHSGPEMLPSEEPGGRQAINPRPHPRIIKRREGNIEILMEEVNCSCRLPEDEESIRLALHLKATLDFTASFNIAGYKN